MCAAWHGLGVLIFEDFIDRNQRHETIQTLRWLL